MKKSIIILLLLVILLIPMVVSCTPADDTQTSDLGRGFRPYQKQDGWVYYSVGKKLYKTKPNGDEKTEISDVEAMNFVIYEDRIYYSQDNEGAIYCCKTDGSEQTFICNKQRTPLPDRRLDVVDGWIYFINRFHKLYKIRTDGTELTQLTDVSVWDFSIDGESIHYITYCGFYNLYQMHTDGKNKTQLTQQTRQSIDFDGKSIYYAHTSGGIYKQDLYINKPIKLGDCDFCSVLKVIGNWVYYNNGLALYKVKTDGSDCTMITDVALDSRFVDVWDNWLIFMNPHDDPSVAHMVRVGNSYKTDALIEEILADSIPDLKIRKYE